MPSSKSDIKLIHFTWEKGNDAIYDLSGGTARFKEGVTELYRPAVSSFELKPGTGKYFWECHVNHENLRMGVCTADVDLNGEMGQTPGSWSVNIQTGACETDGKEFKRLWRLIVPVSGGTFAFLYDTDAGTMQIYFNNEFHGTAFNQDAGLQGKTVRFAVGIGALETHNRNIGIGKKRVIVKENPELYNTIVL